MSENPKSLKELAGEMVVRDPLKLMATYYKEHNEVSRGAEQKFQEVLTNLERDEHRVDPTLGIRSSRETLMLARYLGKPEDIARATDYLIHEYLTGRSADEAAKLARRDNVYLATALPPKGVTFSGAAGSLGNRPQKQREF